ncbi:MAG: glycosyltransferase family 8 protein [Bacilli bacterium]
MNIIVSLNKNYLEQVYVLINSIKQNNDCNIDFYIMYQDLSQKEISNIINKCTTDKFKIHPLYINDKDINKFPITEKRYPREIYFRLFSYRYLNKDIDRVLYLDIDTVVINSLEDLYNSEFNENYFLGCTHVGKRLLRFNRLRLGVKNKYPYINTGIMLINIAKIREHDIGKEISDYVISHSSILLLPDQDVVFALYGDKVELIDSLKYNIGEKLINEYNFKHLKKIDINWIRKNSVVVHYYGKNKPWNDKYDGILNVFYDEYK